MTSCALRCPIRDLMGCEEDKAIVQFASTLLFSAQIITNALEQCNVHAITQFSVNQLLMADASIDSNSFRTGGAMCSTSLGYRV